MNSPNKMKNQLLFSLSSISVIHRRLTMAFQFFSDLTFWTNNYFNVWYALMRLIKYSISSKSIISLNVRTRPNSQWDESILICILRWMWNCRFACFSLYLLKIISHGLSISHRFMPFLLLPYLTSSLFAYMILRNDMKILGEGYRLSSLLTLRALFASQTPWQRRERKTKIGGRRTEKVLNCQFSIEIRSCVKLSPVTGPVECRFFLNF